MIRTFSTLALVTALAGPAMAQDARVSVTGKSQQTLRADIHKAADKVCSKAYLDERTGVYDLGACIAREDASGMAQARAIQQSQPSVAALAAAGPARQ